MASLSRPPKTTDIIGHNRHFVFSLKKAMPSNLRVGKDCIHNRASAR